ncbi:preprotein translocase subunit SecE [Lutispora saccharofermentans]|uniref:Protein translocase subunit SecE n=1 Tax=Lutispora saccharofermentans TaxID=3024236 RepID=A0ABT1NM11_9FIRM|nr:preprotein translocase subunit SecE [Lutispora saccharofermentans]MCQ1530956.1 preprotein translocase subunit SecE [Lutispora saccharofermentans]
MTDTAKKFSMKKYFKETKAEMKKVSWPSRKEVLQHTEVVLVSILIIGVALWAVDMGFGKVLDIFLMK